MNPHSARVKMETRLQFSSNYYQIQSNTLLFTTAFSIKKAITLEKPVLVWAHKHSREPEHSVQPWSTQLIMGSSEPAHRKLNKNQGQELLSSILHLSWGTTDTPQCWGAELYLAMSESPSKCPLYPACSPWFLLLFRAEDGSQSLVPLCPAPWNFPLWHLTCIKLPAITPKAAAFVFQVFIPALWQHESLLSNTCLECKRCRALFFV